MTQLTTITTNRSQPSPQVSAAIIQAGAQGDAWWRWRRGVTQDASVDAAERALRNSLALLAEVRR
jgi:hypothetical protein